MLGTDAVSDTIPRVAEFYHDKSVFLTGASGLVGSVLLELLLRCFPGIKSIYILIRKKKNVLPEARKEELFNKKLFEKLRNENPELLRKVRVISGDISLTNLGMSEEDTRLLLDEVSIVFHCAAEINFKKPLVYLLKHNVLSLDSVIELCRKMRKIEVLVYTSTAYCNCNHEKFPLKEVVYRLPLHATKFLDALKNGDKERLQELVALCKPDWPNAYCFSKCLAENVIADTASDLAVAIIRPSMVFGTWKHPIPGYWEETNGSATIFLGLGKGFVPVLNANPKTTLDFVPADWVANTHVIAAWSLGTKRCAFPLIVNCTGTGDFHFEIYKYLRNITKLVKDFPLPLSFVQQTNIRTAPNKYLYRFLAAYYHYLPAIVMDGMLKISGKKPKIYSSYRILDKLVDSLHFFMTHSFEFERNNMEFLDKLISSEDRKNLTSDCKEATLLGLLLSFPEGAPFYDWKIDKKPQFERQRIMHKRLIQIRCIKGMFLIVCSLLIYWVFSSLSSSSSILQL